MTRVFLSSPLKEKEEKELHQLFKRTFSQFVEELITVGVNVIPSSREEILDLMWEGIKSSHALVAIVAGRYEVNGTLTAIPVYQEIGFADRLNKPIYVFLEETARLEGGIDVKAKEIFIFNRSGIFTEAGKHWLKDAAEWITWDIRQRVPRLIVEPEDLLPLIGAVGGGTIEFFRPDSLPLWLRVPAGATVGGLAGEGLRRLIKDFVRR